MARMNEQVDFNVLYTQYFNKFVRFAHSYVRDNSVAEDLTIISFMKYWENRSVLPPDHNAPAYILTAIKNKCLNHLQHLQTKEKVEQSVMNQSQWELTTRIATLQACEPYDLFTVEIEELVRKSLGKMPETTRRIFVMSRYNNKSHKEIAEEFAMTSKGVEFHISKAIKLLRVALKEYISVFLCFFYL